MNWIEYLDEGFESLMDSLFLKLRNSFIKFAEFLYKYNRNPVLKFIVGDKNIDRISIFYYELCSFRLKNMKPLDHLKLSNGIRYKEIDKYDLAYLGVKITCIFGRDITDDYCAGDSCELNSICPNAYRLIFIELEKVNAVEHIYDLRSHLCDMSLISASYLRKSLK